MAHTIDYDAKTKVWKSWHYPYLKYVKQTIGEVFLKNSKITEPNKVLECYYDIGLEKTMADIHRESITVAINMKKFGLKTDDIVVIYSMVNPQISALTMGSYIMGIPLNFFETKFDSSNTEYTLELLSPTMILFEEEYRTNLEAALKNINLPKLKHLISIDGTSGSTVELTLLKPIPEAEIGNFEPPALGDPQELIAAYMLTSGSTGLPKAVCISHSMMLNGMITWWNEPAGRMDLTKDSIIFSFSPLRWISQPIHILQSLLLGVKRICVYNHPNGAYGREIIRNQRITHFFSSPAVFQDILHDTAENDLDAMSSLRTILVGGEAPSQVLIDLTEKMAPKAKLFRCYGMTEMSGVIGNDIAINGGYLVPGVELKILDDQLQAVGPNTNGQLAIRAPVPLMGYLNVSRENDFYEDGFFNTGDYGHMDDNKALHVLTRYKSLVRGADAIIIPNLVENLINTLPEISSSILVGFRKSARATVDTGALFVKLQQFSETPAEEIYTKIRKLLRSKLDLLQYDVIEDLQIVKKFPLSSCGKVDRTTLIKLAKINCLVR